MSATESASSRLDGANMAHFGVMVWASQCDNDTARSRFVTGYAHGWH